MADQRTVWKVEIDQAKFMAGLKQMASGISTNAAAIDRLNTQTKSLGGRFKSSFAGQVGSVYLLQRAVRAIVGNMIQFGDKMAEIKAITKATGSGFERLSDTVRNLGATTRFTATEAANGMAFLARAGLTADQSIAALPGTLDLASAGFVDVGTAADFTVNVIKQFGLAVTESEKIAGTFVHTANSTNTTVQQLGVTLQYAGSVAGVVGIEFEELAAAAGLLANAGIKGSRAGTQLRGIIATLLDPTKKARDTIEGLGLEVEDLRPGFNDVTGETVTLNDVFTKLEKAGFGAAEAVRIFRKRQLAGALVLADFAVKTKDGKQTLSELTAEIYKNADAAKVAARIVEDTLGGAFRRLKSSIEAVNLTLADEGGFAGLLRGVVDTIAVFIRSMLQVENAAKGVGDAAVMAAGMLEALVWVLIAKGALSVVGAIRAWVAGMVAARIGIKALLSSLNLWVAVATVLAGVLLAANKRLREHRNALDSATGAGERLPKLRAAIERLGLGFETAGKQTKGFMAASKEMASTIEAHFNGMRRAQTDYLSAMESGIAKGGVLSQAFEAIGLGAGKFQTGPDKGEAYDLPTHFFMQLGVATSRAVHKLTGAKLGVLAKFEDLAPGFEKHAQAILVDAEALRVSLKTIFEADPVPLSADIIAWLGADEVEQNLETMLSMFARIEAETKGFQTLADPRAKITAAAKKFGVDPEQSKGVLKALMKLDNERVLLKAQIAGATAEELEYLKVEHSITTLIRGTDEEILQATVAEVVALRKKNEEKEKERELTKSISDALTDVNKETDNLLKRSKLRTKEEKELFDVVTSLGGKYENLSFLQGVLALAAIRTKNAFLEQREANAAITSELKGAVEQVEDLEAQLSGVALTARQLAERKILNWGKGDQAEFEKLVNALENIERLTAAIAKQKALDSFKKSTKELERQNRLQQAILDNHVERIIWLRVAAEMERQNLSIIDISVEALNRMVAAQREALRLATERSKKKPPSETLGRSGDLRNQYEQLRRSLTQENIVLQMQLNGATEVELRLQEEIFQLQNQGVAYNEVELQGLIENNERLKRSVELAQSVRDTLSGAFTDLFGALVSGTESLEDALKSFLQNLTKQLSDMFAQRFFQQLFSGLFTPGGGGIPTLGGDTAYTYGDMFSGPATTPPHAKGGAFSGGIRPFASGGIVKRPTYFAAGGTVGVMGEAGAEAIMPLGRDAQGRLGVRGGGTTVIMNIKTPDADSFVKSKRQIAAAMNKAIQMGQQDQVRGV